MPIRGRSRRILLAALLAVLAGTATVLWLRQSAPELTPAQLVARLGARDATVAFVDVKTLRRAGLLSLLAGSKAAREQEYATFVSQSGFDYEQDLDHLLVAFQGDTTEALLQGRFRWSRLRQYAQQQGGKCTDDRCDVPGNQSGRVITFQPLQSNLMSLKVTPTAAASPPGAGANLSDIPNAPVWVSVSPTQLQKGGTPTGTRLFALALQDAEKILFTVGPDQSRFRIDLNVTSKTSRDAAVLTAQLQTITDTLQKLIAHEAKPPAKDDLSTVLAAGTFRREDRRVLGTWPVERAFLEKIASSGGER